MPDRTEANPNELNQDDARYGFRCCHHKNIWTAPLPPETELSRQMTTSTTSIDIMGLQAAYANLHTDQERDYFMQRYHDVISSFGGKTSYDADIRPLLVIRSNLSASGYDVDGTDQASLGQYYGRVQQTYDHSVLRFFVPEHGTMFTLALVRFPPTATKEIQYLNAKGALTYTDIAGDPVLYGNLPPREISMKDVFRDRKSSSAGMPRPTSYAVFCLRKKKCSLHESNGFKQQFLQGEVRRVICKLISKPGDQYL